MRDYALDDSDDELDDDEDDDVEGDDDELDDEDEDDEEVETWQVMAALTVSAKGQALLDFGC